MPEASEPRETLSVINAVAIVVGMVMGVGIFKTPSIVAANADSGGMVLLFWLLGGLASFIGALCYAELMCAYPHAGGDYHFLTKAFGPMPAFLYAWARLVVIQTGAIAMVAFIVGDYASEIIHLGPFSPSIYAALSVIGLTAINMAGIRPGKWIQMVFVMVILTGLLFVSVAGVLADGAEEIYPGGKMLPGMESLGVAMIFVLLTYGGWNEASFLSAEVKSAGRNMLKMLLLSIGFVTFIYLLANIALLQSLGINGMASSGTVIADMAGKVFGPAGKWITSLLILTAAASTVNAAIITGARTSYAMGRDFPVLGFLGQWQGRRQTPLNALFVQGGIALALVILGTGAHDGFVMMVEYTAPVFWLFFLMVGISVFILRGKDADAYRPFRMPFYPLTPLVFCSVSAFMLYASLAYTGKGALWGVGLLLSGIPLMILQKKDISCRRST